MGAMASEGAGRRVEARVAVDVVIVGGGAQGLLILEALIADGYACALVAEGDVGAGQTLHSHGFLNTGFGMLGPELPAAAATLVHPYLRRREIELVDNWSVLPPPGLPALAGLPPFPLPAGFAPAFRDLARKLPDQSFSKRRLIERLLRGHEDYIIRGSVVAFRGRQPVEAVRVAAEGSRAMVELQTRVVVVAAGCGSKRLLQGLVGLTPQVDRIKHRRVHMVCLRAPRGALPATSVVAMPLGLLLAARDDGDAVTWYVTPMEMTGPSFDDAPGDASADAVPAALGHATSALLGLYPALPQVGGLRVGCYAGYRQDIGEGPGARACEVIDGAANVIAALPSGLVGAWPNVADALSLVHGLARPSGSQPALPAGGDAVRAGSAVEDRTGFAWLTWEEWHGRHPDVG